MSSLTYNPAVFAVEDEDAARRIILTSEGDLDTDARWARETPYLGDLLTGKLAVGPDSLVVDFGCGIGRIAKELIARTGCTVLGVDISAQMRSMAIDYVASARFSAVSPEVFFQLALHGLQADAAVAVWVLQHTLNPANDIRVIRKALRPGGVFAVVNNTHRAVPVVETRWAMDDVDVRALLREHFPVREEGGLDGQFVGALLADNTFWGAYRTQG